MVFCGCGEGLQPWPKLEILYPLVSERLLLRRFETGVVDDYFVYQQLSETASYLFSEPRGHQECLARVQMYIDAPSNRRVIWRASLLNVATVRA